MFQFSRSTKKFLNVDKARKVVSQPWMITRSLFSSDSAKEKIESCTFELENIRNWFDEYIHDNTNASTFRRNDSENPISETCCHYTTHFILNYACSKQPIWTNSCVYEISNHKEYPITQFFNEFATDVLDTSMDGTNIHKMYHFRLNNDKNRQQKGCIHDLLIEKYNSNYIIYQSSYNLFQLKDWLSTNDDNYGFKKENWQNTLYFAQNSDDTNSNDSILDMPLEMFINVRDLCGKGQILNEQDMTQYLEHLQHYLTLNVEKEAMMHLLLRENKWAMDKVSQYCQYITNECWNREDDNFMVSGQTIDEYQKLNNLNEIEIGTCDVACAAIQSQFGLAQLFGFLPEFVIYQASVNVYDFNSPENGQQKIQETGQQNTFGKWIDDPKAYVVGCL